MAFGKGSATSVVEYKKYIGIASLNVKAINPTKVELEKIYGRTLDKEPEYIGEKVIEGVGTVKTLKIDFIVAPVSNSKKKYELIFVTHFPNAAILKHSFLIASRTPNSKSKKIATKRMIKKPASPPM